jgi:hypothetical protein
VNGRPRGGRPPVAPTARSFDSIVVPPPAPSAPAAWRVDAEGYEGDLIMLLQRMATAGLVDVSDGTSR